jgi:hypothetical protein
VGNANFIIEKGSLFLSLGQLIANVAYPPALLVGVFDEAARRVSCVAMLAGKERSSAQPAVGQPSDKPSEQPAREPKPKEHIPGADLSEH